MKQPRKPILPSAVPSLHPRPTKVDLVDEYHLFLVPILVGAGKRALPSKAGVKLELLDQRRFAGG
jgi:hypothetical protein